MSLWKKIYWLQQEILTRSHCCLGLRVKKDIHKTSALWKLLGRPAEKNRIVFLFLSTQGWETLSLNLLLIPRTWLRGEQGFCELQSDHAAKIALWVLPLDKLWISVKEEYLAIHRKAANISLQFSTHYKCEQALTCLTIIMRKRVKIISFWLKMKYICVYLKFDPELGNCAGEKQARVSSYFILFI